MSSLIKAFKMGQKMAKKNKSLSSLHFFIFCQERNITPTLSKNILKGNYTFQSGNKRAIRILQLTPLILVLAQD